MVYLKDEAIVLQTVQVGDKDLSITIYLKNLGKENIYIKGGQIIKNPFLPIVQEFNWFKAVFIKYKGKIFIKEIDKSYNLAVKISQNLDSYFTASKILENFNKYTTFPDKKIFNLIKKTFYFLPLAKNTDLFYTAFLVKYIYLQGIFPFFGKCIKCNTKINQQNFGCFFIKNRGNLCKNCCKSNKTEFTYEDIVFISRLFKTKYLKLTNLKVNHKNLKFLNQKLNDYLRLNFL